jgi:hypothetical protein
LYGYGSRVTGRIQYLAGNVFRTETLFEGTVKLLSNKRKNTATPLAYRACRFITFFLVISQYLLININNVFAAQVTLVWEHINEPYLAGYKIYYGDSSGNYSKA